MIFGLVNGMRVSAEPGMRGECPSCGQPVMAKCGRIKAWHWAHATNDCDGWSEGLTAWHLNWQSRFPNEWQEINVARRGECHRADVCTPSGIVIEFQHSSISPDDIARREKFYGLLMRWVFDAREAFASKRLTYQLRWNGNDLYVAIRWKYPRTSLGYARRPVFLDIGEGLLLDVKKLSVTSPGRGWGLLTNHKAFVRGIGEAA